MDHIRILIAEGQVLLREAMTVVLEVEEDLEVVGAVADGAELVNQTAPAHPDVVVLDVDLPGEDWVTIAGRVRDLAQKCKILLLADDADDGILVQAVEAGASGFLTKSSPIENLIDATRRMHRGETLIPGELLGDLLERFLQREQEQQEAYRRVSGLTRREKETLALLAEGASNEEIARTLGISRQTARKHVQHVLRKLGVHSRLEAAAFVRRNGGLAELLGSFRTLSAN